MSSYITTLLELIEELVMNIYGNKKTYSYENNLDGLHEMQDG